MMKKDAMMAQNLKLLRCACASPITAAAVTRGLGSAAASAQTTELHPNMFDRPNEKLLFRVLHFLLLKLKPQAAQVPTLQILQWCRSYEFARILSVCLLIILWCCVVNYLLK